MDPWLVLGGIAVTAVAFVLFPTALATAGRFRGAWRVPCPDADVEARVRIDVATAVRTELLGHTQVVVERCSLWPERHGCGQGCVAQPVALWRRSLPGEPPPRRPGGATWPTVLVACDGTPAGDRAIAAAADLARARGWRLRVLFVAPEPTPVHAHGRVVAFADQETARVTHEAASYLREVLDGIHGVEVDHVIRFGDPGKEITYEAEDSGAELIVLGVRPRTLGALLAARLVRRVRRAAEVPVLTVAAA